MDKLIQAVLNALRQAGIGAVRAFAPGLAPEVKDPVTVVGLHSVKGAERAVYEYLGMQEEQDGTLLPLYGRRLEAELLLLVYSPRAGGGQVCQREAERVMDVIGGPVSGVKLGAFQMEACQFDAKSDCYRCRITVEAKAYLYALANGDETEFTDFILKGEVR